MPGAIIASLLTLAKKLNNYEINPVGGLKVLWLSTTNFRATCPTSKRWFLVSGMIYRSVSSTVTVSIRDSGGTVIERLLDEGAATGAKAYPETDFFVGNYRILDAAEDINMVFGTAQDAGSFCSAVVLEVDV